MPAGPAHTTRRTALALGAGLGAVGLTAVAGCDADPRPSPGVSTPTATTAEDPDVVLVDDVLGQLAAATTLAGAVGARFSALREPMAALERLHTTHVEALGGSPTTGPGRTSVPAAPAAALALVRRREKALHDRLVASASVAASGPLARLLASMSAAVAQRLATFPEAPA